MDDHSKHSHAANATKTAIDPVCQMVVDPATARSAEVDGKTYYFCSEGCRTKFVADPGKYLNAQKPDLAKRKVAAAPAPASGASGVRPAPATDPELDPGANGPRDSGFFHARTMGPHRAMGAGALLMLACSPKGAEALDVALLRLSYRLDLTADQKPLFDTFREKALTSETSFADTCKSNTPASADNTKPDFLTRPKSRLAIDQARVTALNDVLPSFEALYATLSDTQKAALIPHRPGMGPGGQGPMGGMHRWGQNHGGQGGPMAPSSQT